MRHKRASAALSLTAAAAARSIDPERLAELMGEKEKKPPKAKGDAGKAPAKAAAKPAAKKGKK